MIENMLINNLLSFDVSFVPVQNWLMPLVLLALLIDTFIVAIWYLVGVLLNNPGVRASARSEFYQLIGTAVLIMLVVFVVYLFAFIFIQTFSSDAALGTAVISGMCTNLAQNSQIGFVGSALGLPTNVCAITSTPNQYGVTTEIEYPLAATTVITANLADQVGHGLQSIFLVDAYLGFLSELQPTSSICIQTPQPLTLSPCMPIPNVKGFILYQIRWINTPFQGLDLLFKGYNNFDVFVSTALGSFIAQLLFLNIFLSIWPYLIFVGLLLRVTVFTRKVGGLLIAVAIGAVIFYPTIFAMEYLTINNYLYNNYGSPTGAIPTINACGYTFTPTFFTFPDIASIAQACQCWPPDGSLLKAEVVDIGELQFPPVPIYNYLDKLATLIASGASQSDVQSSFTNPTSYPGLSYQCAGSAAQNTLFYAVQGFGAMGVVGYFLPIINILITLAAIRMLSGLMGGDTELGGLARLI